MKTLREQLQPVRHAIREARTVELVLPARFTFTDHDSFDMAGPLSFFDWDLTDCIVKIDMTACKHPNYQTLTLLTLYSWHLKNQGCTIDFSRSEHDQDAAAMWRRMGARGLFNVLQSKAQQFKGDPLKPLFALRNRSDFSSIIEKADSYVEGFNIEYTKTLRYVLSELLYNAMEHGKRHPSDKTYGEAIPAVVQFTWYKERNELRFLVADIGQGIKRHIEQMYPGQESHEQAIKLALKPQVSGTFANQDPYRAKDNAGMGLYFSTNIIRRLNADMHVVTGDGIVHISPRDVTGYTMPTSWPGTLVHVVIRLNNNESFALQKMMQDFREAAMNDQRKADHREESNRYLINVANYFGTFAEDKAAAIKFRNERLFPAVDEGKDVVIDFEGVISAPHSFLSALLASPIKRLGMAAYKRLRFINVAPEIRETIDFILDDHTTE